MNMLLLCLLIDAALKNCMLWCAQALKVISSLKLYTLIFYFRNFWFDSCQVKADLDDDHCWHKAWKFYGLYHVNFSYCPLTSEQTFFNMFEALSDVFYYKSYENLLTLYQEEPLPNFSDTLGKFFSLAASSPKYLEKLQVVGEEYSAKEARINRLYVQVSGYKNYM